MNCDFTYFREGQGTFLPSQHTAPGSGFLQTVAPPNCFADPANSRPRNPPLISARAGKASPMSTLPAVFPHWQITFEENSRKRKHPTSRSDKLRKSGSGITALKFFGPYFSSRSEPVRPRLYFFIFNINGLPTYLYGGGPKRHVFRESVSLLPAGPQRQLHSRNLRKTELVRSKAPFYLFAQDSLESSVPT